MHTNTEFYDLPNAAVVGWQTAVKRCCDRQPTSHPEHLTAETICAVTGLLPLYPFTAPEGTVATGQMTVEIVDGAAYKRYATITIEEHEARVAQEAEEAAADAAAEAARQALDDSAAHAADLAALAAALAPFAGIKPGMLYPAIEDLMAAQVAAADPSAVAPLTAASLRAMSVYSRLTSAGIHGPRLWRALAALSAGGTP